MKYLVPHGGVAEVRWTFLKSNGDAYPVSPEDFRLSLGMGRGRSEITEFSVTGNVVSFMLDFSKLHFIGNASLSATIRKDVSMPVCIEKRDAFRVVVSKRDFCAGHTIIELVSYVPGCVCDGSGSSSGISGNVAGFELDSNMHLFALINEEEEGGGDGD